VRERFDRDDNVERTLGWVIIRAHRDFNAAGKTTRRDSTPRPVRLTGAERQADS
jgi:hypothetical protein